MTSTEAHLRLSPKKIDPSKTEAHLRLTPKENDIVGIALRVKISIFLIRDDARSTIVRATCGISKSSCIQLIKQLTGKSPIAGQLPTDNDWIIKSPTNCLHASAYFRIYKTIIDSYKGHEDDFNSSSFKAFRPLAYLSAYNMYKNITGYNLTGSKPHLNINRAYLITTLIRSGEIVSVSCAKCDRFYVTLHGYPPMFRFCPVCDSRQDAKGRFRWNNLATKPSKTG
ncbi:FlhC family transcriptional regulator [Methylomonas sp. AM2-LC]|uniref:FlhC family transcriptional regulator n=1 Tax=Methylomonas sp. AM2-LC TaxID=3153301 RepID=UPI00326485D0